MFDYGFSAPVEGRDATILSSISRAISGERAPWRSKDRNPEREDELLRLRRENADLRAEVERLSRLPDSVRDIFASRPHPGSDEDDVVKFELIAEAFKIERQAEVEGISKKEQRARLARRPFARRNHGNNLGAQTRLGDGKPVDPARPPKVDPRDSSDRRSATIIPFPVERAMARKVAIKEAASETAFAPPLGDYDAGVRLDEEATVIGDTSPIEEDLVVAEQIGEDVFSLVDAEESPVDEEGSIALPNDGDVGALMDEGAAASSSEVYDSAEISSDDEKPIVEVPIADLCHRDWTLAQRRHFTAYACVGHSAPVIAKLMKQACGISVSVKTVRLALAERTKKLNASGLRRKPS